VDEDARLITRIQRRSDPAAADALVRKYYDEIFTYVHRQLTDKHAAMDVTQEVFISMLTSLGSYDSRKAGFRTWLYRIATNKLVDYYRSRATHTKHVLETEELEPADERDFTRQIEAEDLLEKVKQYVNGLDADTQRIFRLRFFSQRTLAEIADLLTMPESSVKSKYYRLLRRLKEEFGGDYE